MTRYILSVLLLFTMKWSLAQTTCHPAQCAILLHGSAIAPSGHEDHTMYYFTYPLEGICVDDLNGLLPTLNEHWGSFVYSHMSPAEHKWHEQGLGGTGGKPAGVYGVSWCVSQEEANSTLGGYERRGRSQKLNYAPSDLLQELARCSKTGSTNANDEGINSSYKQSDSSNPSVRESGNSGYPTYRENMAKLDRLEQQGHALEQQWSDYWARQRAMDDERARQEEKRAREQAEAQKRYREEEEKRAQAKREYARDINEEQDGKLDSKLKYLYKEYPEDEGWGKVPPGCSLCTDSRDAVLDFLIREERIYAQHYTTLTEYKVGREGFPTKYVEDREFLYDEDAGLLTGYVSLRGLFWPDLNALYACNMTHSFDIITGRFLAFYWNPEGFGHITTYLNSKGLDELTNNDRILPDLERDLRYRAEDIKKKRLKMNYAYWHKLLKEERGMYEAAFFLLQHPSAQGLKQFKAIYPEAKKSHLSLIRSELFSVNYLIEAEHADNKRVALSRYYHVVDIVEANKVTWMSLTLLNLLDDAWAELKPFLKSIPLEERAQMEKQHESLKKKLSSQILVYKLDDKNSGQSVKFPFTHNGSSMEMTSRMFVRGREDGKFYDLGTPNFWKSNFNDPSEICPQGWRLPTASELNSFIENRKRYFSSLTEGKKSTDKDRFHYVFFNHFNWSAKEPSPARIEQARFLITDDKKKKLRVFKMVDDYHGRSWFQHVEPETKLSKVYSEEYIACMCVREK